MKPNLDYLRKLLTAFEDAPGPTTDIEELEAYGLSYETAEFNFHIRLLHDQGFVERNDGGPGLGVEGTNDTDYMWSVMPLRLTAAGHEFAEALNNRTAFEAVKKSAVSSSLAIMRDIAVTVVKSTVAQHLHIPNL